jgi:hypothetical protein
MVQKTATKTNGSVDALIQDCAGTLQRIASYHLPAALDRRLTWLSENKDTLTEAEREELLALIDFSEDRTIEKLQAKVICDALRKRGPSWSEPRRDSHCSSRCRAFPNSIVFDGRRSRPATK